LGVTAICLVGWPAAGRPALIGGAATGWCVTGDGRAATGARTSFWPQAPTLMGVTALATDLDPTMLAT
jgi:hypothetical protein